MSVLFGLTEILAQKLYWFEIYRSEFHLCLIVRTYEFYPKYRNQSKGLHLFLKAIREIRTLSPNKSRYNK